MELILLMFVLLTKGTTHALWNDLNCPAPRAPENGLSFIFRNGELVHFRCHPGYFMSGKAVAYCMNSHWSASTPDCIPIVKGSLPEGENGAQSDTNYYSVQPNLKINKPARHKPQNVVSREELNSKLFNWETKPKKKGAYGDGPRRLPLINGIWPKKPIQIMSLGPQSTPGPMELVREEVNIAELRNRQQQEVAKQRYLNPNLDITGRRKRRKNNRRSRKYHENSVLSTDFDNRETVISLAATQDGDALSVSESKLTNQSANANRRKQRHQDPMRKKRKGKKRKRGQHNLATNLVSRSSRVDSSGPVHEPNHQYHRNRHIRLNKMAEFRRMPVQETAEEDRDDYVIREYDSSCMEDFYGRDLPKIAPYVQNAFVYRYETKKLPDYPFLDYMEVKYRCLSGYKFAENSSQVLRCKQSQWLGETPQCIENKTA